MIDYTHNTCFGLSNYLVVFVLFNSNDFVYSQVNLDPNIRNIQELKSWPEFHNAVAAGPRLAPLQV